MEHQVFVPVPANDLRAVLRDPASVARCVPGLQQDADSGSGPLAGRLKVRVGGHTVTYRGALSLAERDPGHFVVEGGGTEVRGTGAVKLSLAVRLTEVTGGTRLDLTAEGTADGRAAAFTPQATGTAVRRLLERAAEQLAAVAAAGTPGADGTAAAAAAEDADGQGGAGPEEDDPVAEAEAEEAEAAGTGTDGTQDEVTEVTATVFETDVPPPSLDPFLDAELTDLGGSGAVRPPAEAAHARRTMIGRSAEEVDHAPPRGRYAPVPAPAAATAGESLRWIAPAAALALASAVVLGRALRRRR
ncbi:SRPBCC domain-containing protein [Streptomyces xanthophaeus]|uniref:SRPBCC domain-containing protein n=1 Tax=Streptomyces xanthophaeus TaxID=67385 RepID=UPI0004CD7264|nr:SRPBCC domain-containing protein [Streptomyces xanthophaeus]